MELTPTKFIRLKELLYEIGLKKEFLMIESILRRNYLNKKGIRL